MSGNLYLTGFMGAGKSTVGRGLAQALGRRFVDLDQCLERVLGMPIAQVFSEKGEEAFRRAETRELKKIAARRWLVVATGGGLPLMESNREAMRASGKIIFLAAGLEECRRHLGPGEVAKRPLWQDPEALAGLFVQRQEIYADCDLELNVENNTPEQIVDSISAEMVGEDRLEANLGGAVCPVISTWDGPAALKPYAEGRRVVILTDRNLSRLHAQRYQEALNDSLLLIVAPGERSKSLATAERLYKALLAARVERGDLLVALGGGMVTDLGAYVAATYKRGMGFALVSTSLLGCVDAAVGGKAGVNLGRAKNLVGCFTVPQAVVLDLKALGTLPMKHIPDGLVEAYKTGLVAAPELAAMIQEQAAELMRGEVPALAKAARLSARAKAQVVAEDFTEAGRRRILNLGHTYGHAVEGFNNFRLSHGRAVALGLVVVAQLSAQRGLLAATDLEGIMAAMKPLLPQKAALPTADEAWPVMANDKKNVGGKVQFVLLEGVGRPLIVDDVTPAELQAAIDTVKESWRG